MDAITSGAPIDLMLTDLGLPYGLDGRALAEAARAMRPDLRVLFTSGYGPAGSEAAADFLPKPFGRAALAAAIERQFQPPAPQTHSIKSSSHSRLK
jgi:DNA-binding NtrC family response regulator